MDITAQLRRAFTLYYVQPETPVGDQDFLMASVQNAGYQVDIFTDVLEALQAVVQNPPHFVILHASEMREKTAAWLAELSAQLPETQIFLFLNREQSYQLPSFYALGAYEVLLWPLDQSIQLVRALDRAAEKNYWMHLNESKDSSQAVVSSQSSGDPAFLEMLYKLDMGGESHLDPFLVSWLRDLYRLKSIEDSSEHFLKGLGSKENFSQALYLKYYPARRSLLATKAIGVPSHLVQGLGLDLTQEKDFSPDQLDRPEEIPLLGEMLTQVFSWEDYEAQTLEVLGQVAGVLVWQKEETGPSSERLWREALFSALHQHCELLEMHRRWYKVHSSGAVQEPVERPVFLQLMVDELRRARRIQMPLSLLVLSVELDQVGMSSLSSRDRELLLRLLGKALREQSRVNDVVGKLGLGEFGVLLPHTGVQGAAIKAERLRRRLEAMDLKSVMGSVFTLRVSVGVSEYPSLSQDAEELFQSADAVLYKLRTQGLNRVCVAEVQRPEGSAFEGSV